MIELNNPYSLPSGINFTLYTRASKKRESGFTLYYYFSYQGESYRGSCQTDKVDEAIKHVDLNVAHNVVNGTWEEAKRSNKKQKYTIEEAIKHLLKKKRTEFKQGLIGESGLKRYTAHVPFIQRFFRDVLNKKKSDVDVNKFDCKRDYERYEDWRRAYYDTYPEERVMTIVRDGKRLKSREITGIGHFTLQIEINIIHQLLEFAINNKWYNCVFRKHKLRKEKRKIYCPYKKDVKKVLDFLWKRDKTKYYYFKFVSESGLRVPNEMSKLRWSMIDFEEKQINRLLRKGKPPDYWDVPLTSEAIETLKEYRKLGLKAKDKFADENGNNDWIWLNKHGLKIENHSFTFKKYIRELGLPENFHQYSLRHYFATRQVAKGNLPLSTIAFMMGHTDTKMIEHVYSHMTTEKHVKLLRSSENDEAVIESERVEELEAQVLELSNKNEKLSERVEELDKRNKALKAKDNESQLESMRNLLAKRRAIISRLTTENEALKTKVDEWDKLKKQLLNG